MENILREYPCQLLDHLEMVQVCELVPPVPLYERVEVRALSRHTEWGRGDLAGC